MYRWKLDKVCEMNIRKEIDRSSLEEHKPALHWLLDHYSMRSQWFFVAQCKFQRYGVLSYETRRVWYPTKEGMALYVVRDSLPTVDWLIKARVDTIPPRIT
jgi:hypothetical protein